MTMVYLYYSDRYVSLIFQENKVFEFPSVYDQIYISDFSDDVIFCVQFANMRDNLHTFRGKGY